jgi:hypothetical protein
MGEKIEGDMPIKRKNMDKALLRPVEIFLSMGIELVF